MYECCHVILLPVKDDPEEARGIVAESVVNALHFVKGNQIADDGSDL